jgi:hypothetical protein
MENIKPKGIESLVNVIQKAVNKECGLPEGYNADIEVVESDSDESIFGFEVIGFTVTDEHGNFVGGTFRNEKEVRAFFESGLYKSGDSLAENYVKGVRESGTILTWDTVMTAFCAGMEEQRLRNKKFEAYMQHISDDDDE